MKKVFLSIITALICLSLPLFLTSCSKNVDYLSYVSELRKDIFKGEKDNFSVVVYTGMKEEPSVLEGVKNQTALTVTIKVYQKEESGNTLSVKFSLGDKTYCEKFAYNPVKSTLCCEIQVSALPENSLDLEIIDGENSTIITTLSKKQDGVITYDKALKIATQKGKTYLEENTKDNCLKGEIVIRLLCENERNYYYVCFAFESGEKIYYLINATSEEIIAEKIN